MAMDSPIFQPGFSQRARWWWGSRNWRSVWYCVPAVVATSVVLTVAIAASTKSDRELNARYLAEGKAAFQSGDYPRAITCYERLAATSNEPEPRFRLALAVDAKGDRARATSIIRTLAPEDVE